MPYADFGDPQSLNLYGFVGGNPASKADPDGHAEDKKSLLQEIHDALTSFGDALQHAHMGGSAAIPRSQPCACPSQQKQDNKQNNNNSLQQNTKAEQAKVNAAKGKASEERVLNDKGLAKNTQKVSGSEGKSVPDGLTEKESVEIKDAARVTDSKQARIQQEAAKDSGRTNTLVTGEKTNVTPKASSRYDQIERRKDLGPQK